MSEPVIVSQPVKPVRLTAECEHCEGTELRDQGYVLATNPPKHAHVCPKCFTNYYLDRSYPAIVYE